MTSTWIGNLALLAVAGLVFVAAQGMGGTKIETSGSAASPHAVPSASPAQVAQAAPVAQPAIAQPVTPPPAVEHVALAAKPATPAAKPAAVANTPSAPVAPVAKAAPKKAAPVRPTHASPVASPNVVDPVANPDDAPTRKVSGKVKASTDPNRPPAFGPSDPLVTVLIFSDFQCPVCRRAADATHQIAEEFPGEVRMEFWQNALKMHRNAEGAAIASLAAQRQGRFWQMHDMLFKNQGALDPTSLENHAHAAGLNLEQFKKDIADPALKARVDQERALATLLGARGTPAFVINGKLTVGWGSWNGFRGQVARELSAAKAMTGKQPTEIREARAKANLENPEHFQAYLNQVLSPLAAAAKKK